MTGLHVHRAGTPGAPPLVLVHGLTEWVGGSTDAPTLVVGPVGGHMPPKRDLLVNPLVRLVEVAGCGHQVRRDNPAGSHAVVDPFLAERRG